MAGHPVRNLSVRCAVSQSGRATCESLRPPALLLRSQVLRRSLQASRPSAAKACKGVMITTDALKYLPQMGLDPSRVVGCAGAKCQNSFALANGFAVEAIVAEKLSIAFFCSAGCYLNEIPSNCLARA